jgi:hypothetical protein
MTLSEEQLIGCFIGAIVAAVFLVRRQHYLIRGFVSFLMVVLLTGACMRVYQISKYDCSVYLSQLPAECTSANFPLDLPSGIYMQCKTARDNAQACIDHYEYETGLCIIQGFIFALIAICVLSL